MIFFREISPEVVIVSSAGIGQAYPNAPVIGARWSCDLMWDVAPSPKLLRFTYCTVFDDIVHALGVDPKFLLIVAARLGGDFSECNPSVHDVTLGIKAALVAISFKHSLAVAQVFENLPNENAHALQKVSTIKTRSRDMRACYSAKYAATRANILIRVMGVCGATGKRSTAGDAVDRTVDLDMPHPWPLR